jgi:hypothetical protein
MGVPSGRVLRPRLTQEPTAVTVYDDAGVHVLLVDHVRDKIRAGCSGRRCVPGEMRTDSPEGYEQVKKDWAEQHNGGKR